MRPVAIALLLAGGCLSAPSDEGEPEPADNLLPNGNFEVGVAGWGAQQAEIGVDPTAHSGEASAFVCLAELPELPAYYYFFTDVAVPVSAGRHEAAAWMRRMPDSSGQLVSLVVSDGEAFAQSPAVVADDTWQRLAIAYDAQAAPLTVLLQAVPESDGDCILVDDVSLVQAPE